MGGSPGDVSEVPVTQEKQKKGWRISCDVDEAIEGLENERYVPVNWIYGMLSVT